jgi:PAS domain S-box-containing protein
MKKRINLFTPSSGGEDRSHKPGLLEELEAQNQELREARDHLDRLHHEYLSLFEYAPVGYVVLTPNGFITDVNTLAMDMLGKRKDELVGRVFSLFVAAPSGETFVGHLERAVNTGLRETCGVRLKKGEKDGPFVEMNIWCFDRQTIPNCRMALTDVTPHREDEVRLIESQRRLQESEERLRAVMEQSTDAVALTEGDRYIDVNPSFQRLVGYTAEELKSMTVYDIIAGSREKVRELEKRVLTTEGSLFSEREYRRKDGALVPVEVNLTAIRLRDRTVVSRFVRDVTKRKEAQEEMLRLYTALEQSGEGVLVMDMNGRTQYVNPAFARITGYSASRLKEEPWAGLGSMQEDTSFYERAKTVLRQMDSWSGQMTGSRADGSRFDADVTITVIRDGGQQPVGLVAIARDITEELQTENQIVQLQKMEAIGHAAGGIAHDFNNLLAAVIGNIELASDDIPEELPARANLDQALDAAMRGRDLVRKLLTFSRRSERKVTPIRLGKTVDEAYQLLRVTVPKSTRIETKREAEEDTILADPVEMQQVLMNLCVNASDAIGEGGGQINIDIRNVTLKKNDRRLKPGLSPGKYVLLSVADTGSGMSDEVKQRIFEPFFTTKPEGRGTGMGLAVVYGIVQGYHGAITVESVPGKGAKFDIYLPLSNQRAAADG